MEENVTYDKAYAELQDLLAKIQDENVSIENLHTYINRAKTLAEWCKNRLRQIEENLNQSE